jgi:tetratricopeptide (TPR) repeat protein
MPAPVGSRAAAAMLLAGVVVVHAAALPNGFVYDDHEVVLQQQPVRSFADAARLFAEPHGLPQSQLPYYRPVARLSLLAQKGLHGDRPALFHAANALLLGAIALAAFAVLRAPGLGLGPRAAAWAAAAFTVHPIASEVSFPIASGRETALPALFVLLAMAAWLRGRRGFALAAGAVALWGKEQALVLPALVAWADALGLGADPPRRVRAWAVRLAPWLALVALYLVVRGAVLPPRPDGESPRELLAWIAAHPFGPLRALLYLLQSTLAPAAALLYEPRFAVWFSPVRAVCSVAAFAALVALAFARGPRAAVWFWLGWLPLAMAFHLGWLPLEAQHSERYVFLSLLGVVALAALAALHVAELGRAGARGAAVAGVVSVLALAGFSAQRARFYRDEIAFTRQWVASDPAHGNAHASLGAALARAGRSDEAIEALRQAVRLEPRLAAAWYNLGVLLAARGRRDEAIDALAGALRANARDPDAHFALGVLQAERGEPAAAEAHLRHALALRPDWPEARAALARASALAPAPPPP